jgi:hypothetical protein
MLTIDVNFSCNNVAEFAAGHYFESNRFGSMVFTTFSDNIGSNVLNLQIRNQESSFEYVKMTNNSAALSWKALVHSMARVEFRRFYFVQNSKPFIFCDKMGSAVLTECLFDVPFDEKLFSCSYSYTKCEFDVENPKLPSFTTLRQNICVDRFAVKGNEEKSDSVVWWLIGIAVCIAGGYLLFFGGPKGKDDEERVPFRRAKRLAD